MIEGFWQAFAAITALAVFFLYLCLHFWRGVDETKRNYQEDVRSMRAKIESTRYVPLMGRLHKNINDAASQSENQPIEEILSRPDFMESIRSISMVLKDIDDINSSYHNMIASCTGCWKGFLGLSFLILSTNFFLFFDNLIPNFEAIVGLFVYTILLHIVFNIIRPFRKYTKSKGLFLQKIEEVLLEIKPKGV